MNRNHSLIPKPAFGSGSLARRVQRRREQLGITPTEDHLRVLGQNIAEAGLCGSLEQRGFERGVSIGFTNGQASERLAHQGEESPNVEA